MRDAYIRTKGLAPGETQRGGVGWSHDSNPDSLDQLKGEYELEIGEDSNCSISMLALCVHYDEILQYIEQQDDPLGKLLLQSLRQKEYELTAMAMDRELPTND